MLTRILTSAALLTGIAGCFCLMGLAVGLPLPLAVVAGVVVTAWVV